MYLVKTPNFIQSMYPNYTWRVATEERVLYLSFDDGPIPEVTPWVLDLLHEYRAKGTFFMVGENAEHNPDLLQRVRREGHAVGSHTYNHLNGWKTDDIPYFHNARRCARITGSELFRPPYGRMRPKQARFLQRHYDIVMWDILSGDFDPSITGQQCLRNVTTKAGPGSIVVFHDSLKAEDKLRYVLPRVLEHFTQEGFFFRALDAAALRGEVAAPTEAVEKQHEAVVRTLRA